jgi:CubicO group peptidase (beta-lactamase class C family)
MTIQRIAHCALLVTGVGLILASPVWAQADAHPPPQQQQPPQKEDERIAKVRNFFLAQRSPLAKHAEVFLGASEKHGLDWRLLPSLAIVESAGGIAYRNNNVFGWGNGTIRFASITESIQVIAERLTNAQPYRNKTVEGKLKAYNPVNKSYVAHVKGIMDSIGPATSASFAGK